eukprot:8694-Pelagococcus_subviridis.AAC.13
MSSSCAVARASPRSRSALGRRALDPRLPITVGPGSVPAPETSRHFPSAAPRRSPLAFSSLDIRLARRPSLRVGLANASFSFSFSFSSPPPAFNGVKRALAAAVSAAAIIMSRLISRRVTRSDSSRFCDSARSARAASRSFSAASRRRASSLSSPSPPPPPPRRPGDAATPPFPRRPMPARSSASVASAAFAWRSSASAFSARALFALSTREISAASSNESSLRAASSSSARNAVICFIRPSSRSSAAASAAGTSAGSIGTDGAFFRDAFSAAASASSRSAVNAFAAASFSWIVARKDSISPLGSRRSRISRSNAFAEVSTSSRSPPRSALPRVAAIATVSARAMSSNRMLSFAVVSASFARVRNAVVSAATASAILSGTASTSA